MLFAGLQLLPAGGEIRVPLGPRYLRPVPCQQMKTGQIQS